MMLATSHRPYVANEVLRRDPTMTVTLRREYARNLRGRLQRVTALIRETVVDNDALFLEAERRLPLVVSQAQAATRFDFPARLDKADAFEEWLRNAIDSELLESYDPARAGGTVPNRFVRRAYESGARRAEVELARAGFDIPERAIASFFRGPIATSKLQRLYSRNFEALTNMTDDLAAAIRAELTQGLVEGIGTKEMARRMAGRMKHLGEYRASLIARSELINVHATATLDRLESSGVRAVSAEVEWATASDPCEICQGFEGRVYSIHDARGLIPAHP